MSLTVGHDGFAELDEVLLIGEIVSGFEQAVRLQVCLDLIEIDEAEKVDRLGGGLLVLALGNCLRALAFLHPGVADGGSLNDHVKAILILHLQSI